MRGSADAQYSGCGAMSRRPMAMDGVIFGPALRPIIVTLTERADGFN
ncbi:MAG: hypothetical protein KGQ32_01155 [Xanthomonadaceae bacterium]|nr:hypothetical protein [Xanthomonadaceae bacterium]